MKAALVPGLRPLETGLPTVALTWSNKKHIQSYFLMVISHLEIELETYLKRNRFW